MKLPRPEIKHTRIISSEKKAWPKRNGMAHRVVWRPEAACDRCGYRRAPAIEGSVAMFEEFLSDLGKAFAAGLLTGGAFVAMRGAALSLTLAKNSKG
jgi:hypothetical protein